MSMCTGCHSGCCRSFAIPVTGADILRIETKLGLVFWDFVCRWADPEGRIARKHAPQFYFQDEPQTPFVICLTHEMSPIFEGTTRCKFLVENAPDDEHPMGTAHCGIYDARPGACRAYPTKLNPSEDLAIIYDVPETGRTGSPLYQLCPRPWEPADIDPIQGMQDLVTAKFEMDFFRSLAESWNANPGPWEVFPDFLRIVYAARVLRENKLPAMTLPMYPSADAALADSHRRAA